MPTVTDLLDEVFATAPTHTSTLPVSRANPLVCASCGHAKIIMDDSMPTCTGCGRVDNHVIDDRQEWSSAFGENGRPDLTLVRCGTHTANTDLYSHTWGQSTEIATRWNSTVQVKRFAKITLCQSMNHKDRALNDAYNEIDELCHALPETIRHEAKILWKKFTELKLTRGVVRSGIKANCVLHACAMANVRRTRKEVAEMFKIQPGDVARTYELFRTTNQGANTATTSPSDIVVRMLNEFKEVSRDERAAILRECAIVEDCPELMSKTPRAVAAVVLYRHLHHKGVHKSEITKKCQISLPTLAKIETTIVKYLEKRRAL